MERRTFDEAVLNILINGAFRCAALTTFSKEGWKCRVSDGDFDLSALNGASQVCRTYNFGKEGSSKGMFYGTFLEPIRLNEDPVPWPELDLAYLQRPRCIVMLRICLHLEAPVLSCRTCLPTWSALPCQALPCHIRTVCTHAFSAFLSEGKEVFS
jgi:hypothetical protein